MRLISNHYINDKYLSVANDLITDAEGFTAYWYNDIFGNKTIGYGFKASGYAKNYLSQYLLNPNELMTIQEAKTILEYIITDINNELANTTQLFDAELSINKKAVLIDMAYNLGMAQFLTFDTFLSYLKAGRIDNAVNDLTNTLWYNQVKNRAIRDCLNLYAQDTNYYLL